MLLPVYTKAPLLTHMALYIDIVNVAAVNRIRESDVIKTDFAPDEVNLFMLIVL